MPRHHSCTYSCLFVPSCLTRLLPCNSINLPPVAYSVDCRYASLLPGFFSSVLPQLPCSRLQVIWLCLPGWDTPLPPQAAELYVCFPAHWPPLPTPLTALRSSYRPATIPLLLLFYDPTALLLSDYYHSTHLAAWKIGRKKGS